MWLPLFLLFCLSLEALDLRRQIADSIRERTEREYKVNDTDRSTGLEPVWCSLGHGLEAAALTPTNWAYLQIKDKVIDTLISNTNQIAHYILYFPMNFGL